MRLDCGYAPVRYPPRRTLDAKIASTVGEGRSRGARWTENSAPCGRRDVHIRTDGQGWEVRAQIGGASGRERVEQWPEPGLGGHLSPTPGAALRPFLREAKAARSGSGPGRQRSWAPARRARRPARARSPAARRSARSGPVLGTQLVNARDPVVRCWASSRTPHVTRPASMTSSPLLRQHLRQCLHRSRQHTSVATVPMRQPPVSPRAARSPSDAGYFLDRFDALCRRQCNGVPAVSRVLEGPRSRLLITEGPVLGLGARYRSGCSGA